MTVEEIQDEISEMIPRWPNYFDCERGEIVPADLIGATIIAIGTKDFSYEDKPEGGGLLIYYKPVGGEVRLLTLSFTECGMWIRDRDK